MNLNINFLKLLLYMLYLIVALLTLIALLNNCIGLTIIGVIVLLFLHHLTKNSQDFI